VNDAEWSDYIWMMRHEGFADPGGTSALRASTPENPRNLPCPTCGEPDRLTPKDVRLGYQCDECADRAERGGDRYA
jgi:hypothetical protein